MKKNERKSRFRNITIFIWMIVGILMILALIEGLSIILAVKKYFP